MLNGILYILRTGAPWADLPERYPPYQTCQTVFSNGCVSAADSTSTKPSLMGASLPQKGGGGVDKTKRGKRTKIVAVADGAGLPIAVCAESATPHEVTLVQQTLAEIFVAEPVPRLIGDIPIASTRN